MNSETDVLRSVQRWANSVFTGYVVMSGRHEPQARPGGVVRMTPNVAASGTAYRTDLVAAVTLYLWPEGREGDAAYAEWEARQLATKLRRAITQGAVGSRAFRIPLWDYDGIDADTDLPSDRRAITSFLGVRIAPTVQIQQDPEVDDLFTVFADLRLTWTDVGDQSRFNGPLLTGVQVAEKP